LIYVLIPVHPKITQHATTRLVWYVLQSVLELLQPLKNEAVECKRHLLFLLCDAMLAQYLLLSCVCPSVRPFVCLSQAGNVPKQLNIGSRKQCHTIAQGL